mmetsp:Transcript_56988/g.121077  ORF Transcript_56988/g.121077 Transcript_56988/m.121077 type:complete len:237 (-) Transcript_56988:2372-3082(-)
MLPVVVVSLVVGLRQMSGEINRKARNHNQCNALDHAECPSHHGNDSHDTHDDQSDRDRCHSSGDDVAGHNHQDNQRDDDGDHHAREHLCHQSLADLERVEVCGRKEWPEFVLHCSALPLVHLCRQPSLPSRYQVVARFPADLFRAGQPQVGHEVSEEIVSYVIGLLCEGVLREFGCPSCVAEQDTDDTFQIGHVPTRDAGPSSFPIGRIAGLEVLLHVAGEATGHRVGRRSSCVAS